MAPSCKLRLVRYSARLSFQDRAECGKTQIVEKTSIIIKVPPQIPQQTNGFDCGVFLLMFAKYLLLGKEFSFSCKDMTYLREQIKEELLMDRLIMRFHKHDSSNQPVI